MKLRNFLYTGISAVLLASICVSTSYADNWKEIKKDGVMTVGIEGTYMPFNFMNKDHEADGFDVDMAKAISNKLGVEVKFVPTQWTSLIGGLKSDKFDVIIADMTATPERSKSVDFSVPYNATGAVIICRKDNAKYHDLSDLKGAKVGAGEGTTYADIANSVPGAKVSVYKGFSDYLADLVQGRLDAAINAKSISQYVLQKHDLPLKICSGIVNKDNMDLIAVAVKKGNKTLLENINKAINTIVGTPEYNATYEKWFGKGTPPLYEIESNDK